MDMEEPSWSSEDGDSGSRPRRRKSLRDGVHGGNSSAAAGSAAGTAAAASAAASGSNVNPNSNSNDTPPNQYPDSKYCYWTGPLATYLKDCRKPRPKNWRAAMRLQEAVRRSALYRMWLL